MPRAAPAMISTLGHRVPRRRQRGALPALARLAGIETSRFFGANIGRPGSTLIEVFTFAGDWPLDRDGFRTFGSAVPQRDPLPFSRLYSVPPLTGS